MTRRKRNVFIVLLVKTIIIFNIVISFVLLYDLIIVAYCCMECFDSIQLCFLQRTFPTISLLRR